MKSYHTPVMLAEVIQGLRVEPGKRYIDATIGGGGHGVEIVKLGGVLLGIDTDIEAVENAKKELRTQNAQLKEGKDWKIVQGNFRNIKKIAKENGFSSVRGILFDLGVSSHQLDTPERGFSYRFTNTPLDLRFSQTEGETAAQLVNRVSLEELYDIFIRFAEEELARPIAHAISSARALRPIKSTGDLAGAVETVVRDARKRPGVLSRVFQALRIATNDEFAALREGLFGAKELLEQNGRLVVLTFHSLEDRIVKRFIESSRQWRRITKKPTVAGKEERMVNPRARSAKLRIAEVL